MELFKYRNVTLTLLSTETSSVNVTLTVNRESTHDDMFDPYGLDQEPLPHLQLD